VQGFRFREHILFAESPSYKGSTRRLLK